MKALEDFIIRDMVEDDIEKVALLEQSIFPTPWPGEIFARELKARPKALLLVAELDGRLCGYLVARIFAETVHVTNIAVESEMRRIGVGTALMKECISRCFEKGVKFLRLEVRESNIPARRFYEKFGFRELELRIGYYSDTGEDAVIMVAELS